MTRFRFSLAGGALALGVALCAGAAGAQTATPPAQPYPGGYMLPPQTDADQLAQQLRMLAADPGNIYALINAARLSLKLGDVDSAAALYTRADRAAPGNPQVKVGMARLLVQSERPGEALRLFQEAQSLGIAEAEFGSDRALAYDLVGEQQRAQREYRAVLRRGADDEATRRYALSLGISGLKEPALALLEPLNRRSDRGAWRARAFVLAMTGDRAGADRIATTMMPPGMADGLRPFFDRLPRLAAVDRAFAVHFGQVRSNALRVADARRVPALPALSPEPDPFPPARPAPAPVQVATADEGRKGRKDRRSRRQQALAPPVPVRVAQAAPLPQPPAPTASQLAALGATRLPPPAEAFGRPGRVTVLPPPADAYRPAPAPAPVQLAAATPPVAAVPRMRPPEPAAAGPAPAATPPSAPVLALNDPPVSALTAAAPVTLVSTGPALSTAQLAAASTAPATTQPAPAFSTGPVGTLPPAFALQPSVPVILAPAKVVPAPAAAPSPAPVAVAAITPATGAPPPPSGASGETVLAAIIAGIEVPQSELNASAPVVVPSQPAPVAGHRTLLTNVERKAETRVEVREAKAKAGLPEKALAAKDLQLRKDGRGRFLDLKGRPLVDRRGRPMEEKAAIAWIADDLRKQGIDPAEFERAAARPADAKASARRADAKKPDARKPDPVKTEPQRYWVQVAGGANESTLGKEWTRVQGQAAALKGRQGWTTPLRATNRVLTGPFKSGEEAMALVNTLKKQGLGAFMFTSDAGQKVTRLGGR